MGHIIAVANQKGGVGKTTTTVNLAKTLASLGRRVCLVDGDPQCDLTDLIFSVSVDPDNLPDGVEDETTAGDLVPGISNSCILFKGNKLPKPVTATITKGKKTFEFDIIPATSHLASMEKETLETISIFQDKVRELSESYEYVILDTPPTSGNLQTAALAAATQLLITTELEALSVKNVHKIINMVSRIQRMGNPDLEVLGILKTGTKSDKVKTNTMKHYVSELDEDFGSLVLKTEITSGTDVSTANALSLAVFEYKPRSTQSLQYTALTKEVLQRMKEKELETA